MATETEGQSSLTSVTSPRINEDDGLDEALEKIGHHTCWTWTICFAVGIGNFIIAINLLAYVFFGEQVEYWCRIQELEDAGWSKEQQTSLVGSSSRKECNIPDLDYKYLANMSYEDALKEAHGNKSMVKVKKCQEFVISEGHVSLRKPFNLVCDRLIFLAHLQMIIIVGMLSGSIVFGIISDAIGRKIAFIISVCLFFVAGPIPAIVPNYWVFFVCRFFMGLAGGGIYNVGLVLLLECAQIMKRGFFTMAFSFFWGAGHAFLAAIAYLSPNWRIMQVIMTAQSAVLFISCALIPESPRWLIVHHKRKKAWKIVTKADKTLVPTTDVIDPPPPKQVTRKEKMKRFWAMVKQISRSKEMLLRLILSCILNFLAMATYNILALNAANFGINLYIYVAVSGGIECVCYVGFLFVLGRIGRRLLGIIVFAIGGTALLVLVAIPPEKKIPYYILVVIGIFSGAAGIPITFLICSELLPTEVRSMCIGIATAVARIGPLISPYMVTMIGDIDTAIPHLFCGALCLGCIVILVVLPETRGKPLRSTIKEVNYDSRHGYRVAFHNIKTIHRQY